MAACQSERIGSGWGPQGAVVIEVLDAVCGHSFTLDLIAAYARQICAKALFGPWISGPQSQHRADTKSTTFCAPPRARHVRHLGGRHLQGRKGQVATFPQATLQAVKHLPPSGIKLQPAPKPVPYLAQSIESTSGPPWASEGCACRHSLPHWRTRFSFQEFLW